jgi:hypothetical protein
MTFKSRAAVAEFVSSQCGVGDSARISRRRKSGGFASTDGKIVYNFAYSINFRLTKRVSSLGFFSALHCGGLEGAGGDVFLAAECHPIALLRTHVSRALPHHPFTTKVKMADVEEKKTDAPQPTKVRRRVATSRLGGRRSRGGMNKIRRLRSEAFADRTAALSSSPPPPYPPPPGTRHRRSSPRRMRRSPRASPRRSSPRLSRRAGRRASRSRAPRTPPASPASARACSSPRATSRSSRPPWRA